MPAPDTTGTTAAKTPKPPPVPLAVAGDSRLAALIAQYDAIKPELDRLSPIYKELTDAVKLESRLLIPGQWSIDIWVPGASQPLKVRGRPQRTFDGKRFQKEQPVMYVQYCSWPERWEVGY